MMERELNRREFLKNATEITATSIAFPYVILSSALGKAGKAAPSNRSTLGFIGTGKQSKHLIESFLRPDTQMLAACDVDKLKLQRALNMAEEYYAEKTGGTYKGCAGYSDFRDLLARDDIDAVVIATPDHWHSIMVIQAAQAGKDIYCEKPLSITIAEARAMVNMVRRYGRVFQTGSMQRSDPRFRLACELVRNGYIGKIQRVEVNIVSPDYPMFPLDCDVPAQPVPDYLDWDMWIGPALWRPYHSKLAPHISNDVFPHWRDYKGFGGGMVTDWGAHHFDIAQWGLG
ncbi:MAG: Gfo/Idh/MocA family protein, partial [Phycisphaerae bacterium]